MITRPYLALVSVLCLAVFSSPAVFAAKKTSLKLPEEKALEDKEEVADDWLEIQVSGQQYIVGWSRLKLYRAKSEKHGGKVFLVLRKAKMINPKTGFIRRLVERSLWDSHGRLIRMRTSRRSGDESKRLEVTWNEGHVVIQSLSKSGKSPIKLPCADRPSCEEDALMYIHPLDVGQEREVAMVDLENMKIGQGSIKNEGSQMYEITVKGERTDVELWRVTSTAHAAPVEFYFDLDGQLVESRVSGTPVLTLRTDNSPKLLNQMVYGNPLSLSLRLPKLRAAWKKKGATYANKDLGLQIPVPAGWRREVESEKGTQLFVCSHPDNAARLLVALEVVGDAWELDEYTKAAAGRGDVDKTSKAKFAGQDAIRVHFKEEGASLWKYVVIRKGYAYQFVFLAYPDKKAMAAAKKLARSVRFSE